MKNNLIEFSYQQSDLEILNKLKAEQKILELFETEKIEVDDSVPGTLVDQNLSLCKYQFNCKIVFFKY